MQAGLISVLVGALTILQGSGPQALPHISVHRGTIGKYWVVEDASVQERELCAAVLKNGPGPNAKAVFDKLSSPPDWVERQAKGVELAEFPQIRDNLATYQVLAADELPVNVSGLSELRNSDFGINDDNKALKVTLLAKKRILTFYIINKSDIAFAYDSLDARIFSGKLYWLANQKSIRRFYRYDRSNNIGDFPICGKN